MKIAIVTSSEYSYATLLLKEELPENISLILIHNAAARRSIKKILTKISRIGILGSLIGYYSRNWYRLRFENISHIAGERNIPVYQTKKFKVTPEMAMVLKECEYGISMGNGYIPHRFYSLFKNGMINIHHELLPYYPGAQSVVWPIIHGKDETGFSIHFISSKIDRGNIILTERRSITFRNSLGETVRHNYEESLKLSISSLLGLMKNPITKWSRTENVGNTVFTTPTFMNWLRAFLNFKNLKNKH
ncbi:hypothetical protein MASR2M41_09100 [Flammeovirgaceae bacterium]